MASKLRVGFVVAAVLGVQAFAAADDFAWVIDGSDNFQKMDLNTGGTTAIGNTGVLMAGLASVGNSVYGLSYWNNPSQLYQINTATGAAMPIGSSGFGSSLGIGAFGSTTSGLYALDGNQNLYRFDPTTGAATMIGNIGIANWGGAWNLSSGGANLYFAYLSGNTQEIAQIDTTTGAATTLGALTISHDGIGGIGFVNGTLYAGGYWSPYDINSVDLASLNATLVSNAPSSLNGFWGLAAAPVPEPASLAVLLGGLGFLARRRYSK